MTVTAPMNEAELRNLMYTAQLGNKGPFSIRYPRGNGVMPDWRKPMREIPVGKARLIRDGEELALLSIGHIGNLVTKAAEILEKEQISIAHYDMRFLKPIDEEILHAVCKKFKKIITIEDGTIVGGLGSAVLEFMADHNYHAQVKRLGVPDHFVDHGSQQQLYNECGYDVEGICRIVKTMVKHGLLYHAG